MRERYNEVVSELERWSVETVDHETLPLLVATDGMGRLVYVGLGGEADRAGLEGHARRHAATLEEAGAPSRAATQLREYLQGTRTCFDLDLRPLGTEFEQRTWAALLDIPHGETSSYGEQAAALGQPTAARAVGRANGKNPIPVVIPCHRVIGRDGSLTGFGGGLDAKRWLLEHEAAQASLFGSRPAKAGGRA